MVEKTYRIGEVANMLELKSYVLRFWETEFSQLDPLRTNKGQRVYTESHVALLKRIKYLLHEQGMTIDGARRMLKMAKGPHWHGEDNVVDTACSTKNQEHIRKNLSSEMVPDVGATQIHESVAEQNALVEHNYVATQKILQDVRAELVHLRNLLDVRMCEHISVEDQNNGGGL